MNKEDPCRRVYVPIGVHLWEKSEHWKQRDRQEWELPLITASAREGAHYAGTAEKTKQHTREPLVLIWLKAKQF